MTYTRKFQLDKEFPIVTLVEGMLSTGMWEQALSQLGQDETLRKAISAEKILMYMIQARDWITVYDKLCEFGFPKAVSRLFYGWVMHIVSSIWVLNMYGLFYWSMGIEYVWVIPLVYGY